MTPSEWRAEAVRRVRAGNMGVLWDVVEQVIGEAVAAERDAVFAAGYTAGCEAFQAELLGLGGSSTTGGKS